MRLALAACLLVCAPALADTLDVPGDWPTIQAAFDHVNTGDTVLVQPGTYHEALFWPPKSFTLESAGGAAVTIVDASGLNLWTLRISQSSISALVRGFTLTGGNAGGGGGVNADGIVQHVTLEE